MKLSQLSQAIGYNGTLNIGRGRFQNVMTSQCKGKRILLIDRQEYWRSFASAALENAGNVVCATADYDDFRDVRSSDGEPFDLTILGCPQVGGEEEQLISRILEAKQHLLVLCSSPSWQLTRSLFLLGVEDIAEKTYEASRLVKLVDETFENMKPPYGYRRIPLEPRNI